MNQTTDIFRLCDHVRETAFDLHCYHRHGHLEKIYENGLAHRLRKSGIVAVAQHPLAVLDEDGTPLGVLLRRYFCGEPVDCRNQGVQSAFGRTCRAAFGLPTLIKN